MTHSLPDLPYAMDALAPLISKETLEYHWGKHHRAYVDKLNKAIEGTADASKSLEDLVRSSKGGVFNNAAQHWNHAFYWKCLSPSGGGAPTGRLAEAIKGSFGSFEDFRKEFTDKAATLFGSGWTWLVQTSGGKLAIQQTSNAGCPLTTGDVPLLTCDVWEHAYYVDYRNDRARYLNAFWDMANWDHAAQCLKQSKAATA